MLTTHAKKILYFAQIHSLLTYGLVIWGNMISASDRNCLQKLQNRGVQMITPHKELSEIYKAHSILTLEQLTKLENIKLWYKHNSSSLPLQLRKNMTTDHRRHSLEKNHNYNTRNRNVPNLPQTTVTSYKNSFLSKGLHNYQLCAQEIKDSRSLKHCVKLMKRYLFSE